MAGISEDRRAQLWARAERMRIGMQTVRSSREAFRLLRAEATRTLPEGGLAWFNPGDYVDVDPTPEPLPVRKPARRDPRFEPAGLAS